MSNNNYSVSAVALCDELDRLVDDYASGIADDALGDFLSDQRADVRFVLADVTAAVRVARGTLAALRYDLEPGTIRQPDPWATRVTRRSLHRTRRHARHAA